MLMVAAAQRNIGKTELACAIAAKFAARAEIIGVKVTVITRDGAFHEKKNAGDHRKNAGELSCLISEETDSGSPKDSSRLLAAGAKRVFWMQVREDSLDVGAAALLGRIGDDVVTVCESNSMRNEVTPSVFLMVKANDADEAKPSAEAVQRFADRIVRSDKRCFEEVIGDLELIDGKWKLNDAAGGDES